MNAKIIYHEAFSDEAELPTIEECAEFIENDLGVYYDRVVAELRKVDFDNGGRVDENMFAALYINADEAQVSISIKADRSLCTSLCDRCSRLRLSKDFLCSTSRTLRTHCFHCRGDVPLLLQPRYVFCRIDLDALDGERLSMIHLMNMESAAVTGKGIDCYYKRRTLGMATQEGSSNSRPSESTASREVIEERIRQVLFRTEGYHYSRSKTGVLSSRFICTQRIDTSRDSVANENRRKRCRRASIKSENCSGVLTIKFSKKEPTAISCFHEYLHESVPQVSQMSDEASDKIRRGAGIGLTPFQILTDLNSDGKEQYTWGQVYYRWSIAMESMYKSSSDVIVSARAFLARSRKFKEIYCTQEPFALGFLCNHAQSVCEQVCVKEAYIDSTFKTNSSKFELFAVLGSLLGTGFPVAYLLLQPGSRNGGADWTIQRKTRIEEFLRSLQRELISFQPIFFFTDKDFGQICAIKAVYKVTPSICLWHMKRALKRKLDDLKKNGVEELTKEQRGQVLDLITRHFNSHPFFSTTPETIQSLYLKNLQELSRYCDSQSLPNTYSYLLSSWYTWNRYELWGRRHPTSIAFTKTTMTIEAHWSLVKRQYLLHHNRPRIDFVLYILETRLMPKVETDYSMLLRGLKTPKWWRDFKKEWAQAQARPPQGSYSTNAGTWTCSCPSYRQSRFLFCKHLVFNRECPAYRALVRNRHPPFLQFRIDPHRHTPDMGGELLGVLSDVTVGASLDTVLEELEAPPVPEQNGGDKEYCRLEELLDWTKRHISGLKQTAAGSKQIEHLERNVVRRLQLYRERVERSQRSRSAPKTWEHADTLFLA